MSEHPSSDQRALQLDTTSTLGEIEVSGPDRDGDFEIYLHSNASARFISTEQAKRLRDWLNEVLP